MSHAVFHEKDPRQADLFGLATEAFANLETANIRLELSPPVSDSDGFSDLSSGIGGLPVEA